MTNIRSRRLGNQILAMSIATVLALSAIGVAVPALTPITAYATNYENDDKHHEKDKKYDNNDKQYDTSARRSAVAMRPPYLRFRLRPYKSTVSLSRAFVPSREYGK